MQARLRSDLAVRLEGPASLPTTAFNASYRVLVDNRGNAPATGVSVRVEGNTLSALSLLVAPRGWRCDKQLQPLRSAVFVCTTAAALQPGAQTAFQLTVATKPIPAERAVQVQATASSSSPDANPADNAARISTPIGGGAGLR